MKNANPRTVGRDSISRTVERNGGAKSLRGIGTGVLSDNFSSLAAMAALHLPKRFRMVVIAYFPCSRYCDIVTTSVPNIFATLRMSWMHSSGDIRSCLKCSKAARPEGAILTPDALQASDHLSKCLSTTDCGISVCFRNSVIERKSCLVFRAASLILEITSALLKDMGISFQDKICDTRSHRFLSISSSLIKRSALLYRSGGQGMRPSASWISYKRSSRICSLYIDRLALDAGS